jgi:hypothetical protein
MQRTGRVIHLGPLGCVPPAQQLRRNPDLLGDLSDGAAGVDHQMSSVTTVRRGVPLFLGTHKGILS